METTEGLQKAAKRLQAAAGIFAHLRDHAVAALQSDPTPDLEPDTLSVVADLMLAQAQEIVTLKAISDSMKDAIVAKLCSQCDDMFSSVMRSMQVCLLLHSQTQGGHKVGAKGGPLANF